ncbi:MAG: flagellar biosynthetic protein FliR [Myxococcota bacterium]
MGGWETIYDSVGLRGNLSQTLMTFALIMMRIVPIIFQTPFMGGKLVPTETRIGLSLGLSILVFPFAEQSMTTNLDINWLAYIIFMGKELFIGFVIGFVAAELFYAMEIGGRVVDVMRGSNMAEVQVPELQLRASPIGQFNFQLLLVVFCALNGHGLFIESVIDSFDMVAIDAFPALTRGFDEFVDQILIYTASLFGIAFALVFPGLFASFLVDVVFGMFNRIAPQLNAYFMAMGVKAMAGLTMFMFALVLFSQQLAYRLEDSLKFLNRLVAYLA